MSRVLPIGITAFIIASLAIFFFGDSGLTAWRGRAQYERSLAANVEKLKERTADLQARLQLLKTDRQTIVVMAREIGMYEPGDTVVKVIGRPPQPPVYVMGDLLRMRKVESGRNASFKEIALIATLFFVLLALAAARLARKREKRQPGGDSRSTGTPIHSALLMQKIRPFESAHGAGRR